MLLKDQIERHLATASYLLLADGDPPADQGAGGGGDPPAEPGAGDPPADGGDPPAAKTQADIDREIIWRDRQIDRQHRKIKELEPERARREELEAELVEAQRLLEARAPAPVAAAGDPPAPAPRPAPAPAPAPAPRQTAPAIDPVKQAEFNIRVGQVTEQLQGEEYKEKWVSAAGNLEKLGGISAEMMEDIMGTDAPAHVIVELGSNPERYQAILIMPPARQRNELFKIASAKAAAPKPAPKPSGAPAPVEHVAGGRAPAPQGSVDLYSAKVEDDQWYAERMRQKRDSAGRPWSVGGRAGAGR